MAALCFTLHRVVTHVLHLSRSHPTKLNFSWHLQLIRHFKFWIQKHIQVTMNVDKVSYKKVIVALFGMWLWLTRFRPFAAISLHIFGVNAMSKHCTVIASWKSTRIQLPFFMPVHLSMPYRCLACFFLGHANFNPLVSFIIFLLCFIHIWLCFNLAQVDFPALKWSCVFLMPNLPTIDDGQRPCHVMACCLAKAHIMSWHCLTNIIWHY